MNLESIRDITIARPMFRKLTNFEKKKFEGITELAVVSYEMHFPVLVDVRGKMVEATVTLPDGLGKVIIDITNKTKDETFEDIKSICDNDDLKYWIDKLYEYLNSTDEAFRLKFPGQEDQMKEAISQSLGDHKIIK